MKNKFVFILGAGSSINAGYSSGAELIKKIILYRQDSAFTSFMQNLGFLQRDINIFCNTLEETGLNSIDTFLSRVLQQKDRQQPIDFEKIGKASIAYTILLEELQSYKERKTFSFDDNWCRHIFSFIQDDYHSLADGSVRFITFNYDFSLEYFIYSTYKSRNYLYAMSQAEKDNLDEFVKSIKVLHLYGTVGEIMPFSDAGRAYGDVNKILQPATIPYFWVNADKVEIARPDKKVPANFKLAKEYMSAANYIFFIGFGFDRLNMDNLGLVETYNGGRNKTFVTRYKADDSSVQDFESRICLIGDIKKFPDRFVIGTKEEKAEAFLKNNCSELINLNE